MLFQFQISELSVVIVKQKQMWVSILRQAMWCQGEAGQHGGQLTSEVLVKVF